MKIYLVTNILQTYLNQRRPLNKRIFYLPDNVVWLNFGMPAMEWALAIYHHIKKNNLYLQTGSISILLQA